jgi:hypothetical protein
MAANPVCASHLECFAEIGACQRMPSGPAVLSDRTKRPDTRPQNRSSHYSNKSLAKQGPSTQGAENADGERCLIPHSFPAWVFVVPVTAFSGMLNPRTSLTTKQRSPPRSVIVYSGAGNSQTQPFKAQAASAKASQRGDRLPLFGGVARLSPDSLAALVDSAVLSRLPERRELHRVIGK